MADPSWPAVDAVRHLDPRVWLLWGLAAVGPALFARNPFPLFATLVAVLTVRAAWAPAVPGDGGWRLIVRLALVSAVLSVLFNALTAPFGDAVLFGLPGWWPFGDVVTGNAILFGGLTALAITVIVLATTTAGQLTDWPELLRRVPGRLLPLAVAGSVAWGFVPGTIATLRDIRDAQRVRGIRVTSARAVLPILLPLIATALDRATTLAEALETRGFGGRAADAAAPARRSWPRSATVALAVALAVTGVYVTLDGETVPGVALLAVAFAGAGLAVAGGRMAGRTRYRIRYWRAPDTAVAVAALIALVVDGVTLATDPDALRYSPYPEIGLPAVNLPVILAAALLMVPAFVAPLVRSGIPIAGESGLAPATKSMAGGEPLPPAPSPSGPGRGARRRRSQERDGEGGNSRLASSVVRMRSDQRQTRPLAAWHSSAPHRGLGENPNVTLSISSLVASGGGGGDAGEAPDSPLHPVPARTIVPNTTWDRDGEGPGEGLTARHRHGPDRQPSYEAVINHQNLTGVTAPAGAGQGKPRPYVRGVASGRRSRAWASWPGRVRPPLPVTRGRRERSRLLMLVAGD